MGLDACSKVPPNKPIFMPRSVRRKTDHAAGPRTQRSSSPAKAGASINPYVPIKRSFLQRGGEYGIAAFAANDRRG